MPIIKKPEYKPGLLLRSGHINTIYPYLTRKQLPLDFHRQQIETPDNDFIDVDILKNTQSDMVAILCHGLEGSSESLYIRYTADKLFRDGWSVIAMNYRGCSGRMNRQLQMYHSGFTDDLHLVIKTFAPQYNHISLIGYSLGGNILCKYLGDGNHVIDHKIQSAVAISVPCDLSAGARQIAKWENYFYEKRFLSTLIAKIKQKHELFPDRVDLSSLKKISSLWHFDEYYTGPLHGFSGAEDYYAQCHCKQFLHGIDIPCLIINALDDPFLPVESYPYEEANQNPDLALLTPEHGGHVGFVNARKKYFWEEEVLNKFINDPSDFF